MHLLKSQVYGPNGIETLENNGTPSARDGHRHNVREIRDDRKTCYVHGKSFLSLRIMMTIMTIPKQAHTLYDRQRIEAILESENS